MASSYPAPSPLPPLRFSDVGTVLFTPHCGCAICSHVIVALSCYSPPPLAQKQSTHRERAVSVRGEDKALVTRAREARVEGAVKQREALSHCVNDRSGGLGGGAWKQALGRGGNLGQNSIQSI